MRLHHEYEGCILDVLFLRHPRGLHVTSSDFGSDEPGDESGIWKEMSTRTI